MLFLSKMTCECSPKTLFPTDTLTWGTCLVLQKLPLTSFLNISSQGGFYCIFLQNLWLVNCMFLIHKSTLSNIVLLLIEKMSMLPHGNAVPQWNLSMYFHWDFININNMIEVIYLFEVFIVV